MCITFKINISIISVQKIVIKLKKTVEPYVSTDHLKIMYIQILLCSCGKGPGMIHA